VGEHDRALGLDRLAERDAAHAGDEEREPVAALFKRALAAKVTARRLLDIGSGPKTPERSFSFPSRRLIARE
jgi:hypothetical protein